MAEAVWETLTMYGIRDKIIAFMMDNATNNDTLVDGISRRCRREGIPFDAKMARLRCMPHTVHLAALKLLEGIGAINKKQVKKASSKSSNYQDSATAPVHRDYDDEAAMQDEAEDDEDELDFNAELSSSIFSGVEKLRKIVRAVRSSPQRKQTWLKTVKETLETQRREAIRKATDESRAQAEQVEMIAGNERALMLILDVCTRWSSTHQMMRRALDYRDIVDEFVCSIRDFRDEELLTLEDWNAIELVTGWLKAFRVATTEMSTTRRPMLSTTHTVFRGLQSHLRDVLRELPDDIAPQIKTGLIDAHRKLSDYYYKYDESPLYTWAALLDPRVSYEGMLDDYADDETLLEYLESAKTSLHLHFRLHYAHKSGEKAQSASSVAAAPRVGRLPSRGSPQKMNFTSRRNKKPKRIVDELDEYFKLDPEDYDACDPVKWWMGRRAQFPNLFWLARDLLTIPGSAVAVERIFSGGRDTLSIRRASLKADTIRMLMLVKHRLHLARTAVDELLRSSTTV